MKIQEFEAARNPPNHVDLVYRQVGSTHIFSTKAITGLIHVGDDDLETAYDLVIKALNLHVTNVYGVETHYVHPVKFSDFASKVANGRGELVEVVLDQTGAACSHG
jgi:hypothetical protein